jgi:preprotein translocase subunit SecA
LTFQISCLGQNSWAGPIDWLTFVKFGSLINHVKSQSKSFESHDDQELKDIALDLGFEARKSDKLPSSLLVRAFALVQTAALRQLAMTHYDVQLTGGLSMVRGHVAEMRTGEGKTLAATLPLFVHALSGRGALLATSNDYLAKRDALWMQPIYKALGLTVGVIQSEMSREQRRAAYQSDITYGTMKEFGFDFLRDHSMQREQKQRELWYGASGGVAESAASRPVHRKPNFLLIDEADSILIDDARTPLIISAAEDGATHEQQMSLYMWSSVGATKFEEDEEYWYDRERRKVDLTPEGTALVRDITKPPEMDGVGLLEMYDFMERAIQVERDYKLDRDYVVRDGEIVIVDEATGRISEGRRWSRGIHQAIEAKELVTITMDTHTQAKITVQSFVSRFPYIAGMTGTAFSSRREFKKIYGMGVTVIPPNRPSKRVELPVKFCLEESLKFAQVVEDVIEIHQTGRPILLGTRSIAKSEILSKLLQQANIDHEVLNARQVEREAEIVATAGERGRITVATNMAGRGTDIKIDEEVCQLGGMHVVGTEMHESSRIDQQLFGRCGRQGDPGTVQLYISAEDKLLDSAYGKLAADRYRKNGKNRTTPNWLDRFTRAQRKVENQHYRARRILMYNEKELAKAQREMGLDPILDNYE